MSVPSSHPADPSDPSDLPLTVSAVARRLGVAPATLRTWDRRYGLGPSAHAMGRHRRYHPTDVARLETMQQALTRGATPAEAADYALRTTPRGGALLGDRVPRAEVPRAEVSRADGGDRVRPRLVHAVPEREYPGNAAAAVTAGGGTLGMPGAGRAAQGLARAVLALDSTTVQRLLSSNVTNTGVERTWEDLVRPVMAALSRRWELSGSGVELEHLLSECVISVMSRVMVEAPRAVTVRPVLLCSIPGDRHSLPLRVLAATLAQARVATSLLGADLPAPALAAAVGRTAPAAVLLWAQRGEHADLALFDALPRTRPRTRCFAGGPGWAGLTLPTTVTSLHSLGEAHDALRAAAGRPGGPDR